MTDNIENLLLEHLKALRNEVAILRVEMHDEFRDLKQRVSSLGLSLLCLQAQASRPGPPLSGQDGHALYWCADYRPMTG